VATRLPQGLNRPLSWGKPAGGGAAAPTP
jgi:hypothetical protein